MTRGASIFRVVGAQFALLAIAVGLWAWATETGRISPVLMPTPTEVAARLPSLVGERVFWIHLRTTLYEISLAILIAVLLGILIGVTGGQSERGAAVIEKLLRWIQTVPVVLLYPLCILFFGLGIASKVVFGVLVGFFPVALNTLTGVRTVDRSYHLIGRSLGASRAQTMWQITLPASRPLIVSGVRMGASLALLGVIAGEILGSLGGLGYQISASSATFKVTDLYGYIFVTLVIIGIINLIIGRAEAAGPRSAGVDTFL